MTRRADLDRWVRDTEWVDVDPDVGRDAMRWRPESAPATPFLTISFGNRPSLFPTRPQPTAAQVERLTLEANALWAAIGQGYRELPAMGMGG